MSRFLEGSMSDRASAAPPGMFVGWEEGRQDGRGRGLATTAASAAAAPVLFARRSMQAIRPAMPSFPSADSSTSATSAATTTTTTESTAPRRPRSFLAPLWDGVTRHLHWRTRSNADLEGEQPKLQQQQQQQQQTTPFSMQGQQPSTDEILANYHQLMEAGFFSQRAIPATRQGLTRGAAATQRPPTATKGAFPLPTATATAARGRKRGHADDDDDDDNDNDDDNDQGERSHAYATRRHHPSENPVDDGEGRRSLRSRGQQPRKLRKPSVRRAAGDGDDASFRSRLQQHQQQQPHHDSDRPLPPLPLSVPRPVAVHQALPRASQRLAQKAAATTAATAVPPPTQVPALGPASGRRTLSKKRKSSTSFGHSARSREQMRVEDHHGDDSDGDGSNHASKRKKRTPAQAPAAPVVVHHAPSASDNQQQQQKQEQEWRLEQTLPPRPGPSQEGDQHEAEPALRPISFHYPQRVRVRRPLQETTQGLRLRAQGPGQKPKGPRQGRQDRPDSLEPVPKPRTAAMLEDEENVVPLW